MVDILSSRRSKKVSNKMVVKSRRESHCCIWGIWKYSFNAGVLLVLVSSSSSSTQDGGGGGGGFRKLFGEGLIVFVNFSVTIFVRYSGV